MVNITKKKLKLCFICDMKSIHSQKWVNFFVSRGHEVHIIAPNLPKQLETGKAILHSLERKKSKYKIFKLAYYLRLAYKTKSLIKEIAPDILNVLYVTDFGFWAALSKFSPFVITPWGSDILRHPEQKKLWYYINAYALRNCELIIANSEVMRDAIKNKLRVRNVQIKILIWTGVDFGIFRVKNTKLKKKLKVEKKFIIFSNRNLEPLYNINYIIKMFAKLKKKIPDSVLIIAGEGSQRQKLVYQCRSLNLDSSVIFLGKISPEQMNEYLNIADIFITIPDSDSCPSSMLEAFACKKGVIASDIPANRSWIINGENGWLINPRSKEQFLEACYDVLRHPIKKKSLNRNYELVKKKAAYFQNMINIENEYLRLDKERTYKYQ